jgi:hypothetical protein
MEIAYADLAQRLSYSRPDPSQPIPQPHAILRLTLSARSLARMELLSDPSPICSLYVHDQSGYRLFGRTEVLPNKANPVWYTHFRFAHFLDATEPLLFTICDYKPPEPIDSRSTHETPANLIGSCETDIATLFLCDGHDTALELRQFGVGGSGGSRGTLVIHVEVESASSDCVFGVIQANNLVRMRALSRNSAFFLLGEKPLKTRSCPFIGHRRSRVPQ